MEVRTFEALHETTSLLGFGCMRLPCTPEGAIDEAAATAMIDKARQGGVRYFDTAYFYHDHESEAFLGRALSRYPREDYLLATKLPCVVIESLEDAKRIFAEQLQKLQTDHFDFYLMHALSGERWDKMAQLGIPQQLEQWQREGKIRHLGFSFHDSYAAFEHILTARKWDFCQIQFNYMDVDTQAGMRGYALAEKMGVPLVVMEPIKGGRLATMPQDMMEKFRAIRPQDSAARWALRWVASLPNVKVILSGMSTMPQLEENLETFSHLQPLTEEEQTCIADVRTMMRARTRNGCTGCRYCMPCPAGVSIPQTFSVWNEYGMYNDKAGTKEMLGHISPESRADHCVKCGKCETLCPQHLPIREDLQRAFAELSALTNE